MVTPGRSGNPSRAALSRVPLLRLSQEPGLSFPRAKAPTRFTPRTGALMIEFLVAMALVMGALLPLAYSFAKEKRLARSLYQRAVAMEIVDGQLEVLAAGGWKACTNGVSTIPVRAQAATNLPPGRLVVIRADKKLTVEWVPLTRQHGGTVVRTITLP